MQQKNCLKSNSVTVEEFLQINSLNVGILEYFMGFGLDDVYPNNPPDQITYERGRLFAAYLKSKGYKYSDFYFQNNKHIKGKFNTLAREYCWYANIDRVSI